MIPQTEAYFKYGPLVIDTYTQIECEENLDMSDIYFGRQDGANILFTQTKNIKLVDKKHVNGRYRRILNNFKKNKWSIVVLLWMEQAKFEPRI